MIHKPAWQVHIFEQSLVFRKAGRSVGECADLLPGDPRGGKRHVESEEDQHGIELPS